MGALAKVLTCEREDQLQVSRSRAELGMVMYVNPVLLQRKGQREQSLQGLKGKGFWPKRHQKVKT